MSDRFRPDPDDFERCVGVLCTKIQTIAMRTGMSDVDCDDLERSLAAMPLMVRDRVNLMLNGVEIHTEYDDATMAFSARYLLRVAQAIWEENPHPVIDSAHRPGNHRRT